MGIGTLNKEISYLRNTKILCEKGGIMLIKFCTKKGKEVKVLFQKNLPIIPAKGDTVKYFNTEYIVKEVVFNIWYCEYNLILERK